VLSADEAAPDTTGGEGGAAVVDEVLDDGMGVLDELLGRGIRAAAAALGATTGGEAGSAALRDTLPDAAGSPSAGETGNAVLDGGGGGGAAPAGTSVAPAVVDVAGTLPLTGLPAWPLLAAGLWTLVAGFVLMLFACRPSAR
jgi:hypothetical protein